MPMRRGLFIAIAATLSMATIRSFFQPQPKPPMKVMFVNTSLRARGPANRSLARMEEAWMKTRFHMDAMMEDGRIPRETWDKAKLNGIHGTFDIRDPADGELLQKVVNGVRVPT
jgi:hypothetical protein